MRKNILCVNLLFAMILFVNVAYSQATYVQGSTAAQLATQLSSVGFTITNPVITSGAVNQKGTFSNGIIGAGLTIDNGILLSTGEVASSFTNQSAFQSDVDAQGGTPYNDVDLTAVNVNSNNDTVIFDFDFTISGTEPKVFALDYQFASEEYPDYVCSDKNDVFGFFVSGGDLTGTTNIASIGGDDVAVNYVNEGIVGTNGSATINPCVLSNSASFNVNYVMNDNGTPADVTDDFLDTVVNGPHHMAYNGFTDKLRAYTILRPGITYHMKMAIADTADAVYDSGIFIAPIQIFNLPPKSDIDFDGVDDYVNTRPFFGGYTGTTMMSWIKLDNTFSSLGDICGQDNFRIFVDGSNRLKAFAKTGTTTYTYSLTVNDNSPADGWTGNVRVRINGGAWLFLNVGGFPTDFITPNFGNATDTYTFQATAGDTIDIEYVSNGATAADMNDTSFQLYSEDTTLVHNSAFNTLAGDTSNSYVATCAGCPPVVTVQTPNASAPVLSVDQWYNATAKFDGTIGALTLYLNGAQVWQGTGLGANLNINDDVVDFAVGRNSTGTNNYFKGAIDEVKVYDLVLSDTQIQEQIYQEIENVGGFVTGSTIPKAIDGGSIPWGNLKLYYDMDSILDITMIDNSSAVQNGFINNITSVLVQSAPLPYVANTSGTWVTSGTWQYGNVWDIENLPNKDWAIVQVTDNVKVTTTNSHSHLGLLVDSGSELEIQNDQLLNNTSYLKLDGQIDLVGESQLIQTENSDLDVMSAGYLERDQQGQTSIYNYNFWSSPVNPTNAIANNTDYSIAEILKDGTTTATPQTITFDTSGYNGAFGSPITLADYWVFKYVNQPDLYANWMSGHIRSTGTVKVGEGYTQKGTGSAATTQNYVFSGKPNNGIIQHNIGANNVYLVGNPYASALDANQFINDNLASVENVGDVIGSGASTGALYFWEHFSTNNSHVFAAYEGGYATYNLAGGVIAIPDPDVSSSGTGTIRPGRYVPVAQGFFVQGSPAGGTIEFNNGQRAYKREAIVADDSVFTKTSSAEATSSTSSNTIDLQRVYFKFTTPEGPQRELLLAVKNGLADGMNYGYDARLIDDQVTDCAWVLKRTADVTDEKLVIQGIGAIYEDLELPLQIKVGAEGICKFETLSLTELDSSIEVYFLDKESNASFRLEAGVPVEFNLASGEYNNRFYVVFKLAEVMDIDEVNTVSDDLVVFYNATTRSISISDSSMFLAKNVSLYNVLGQEILKNNTDYTNVTEVSIPVQVATGTYLVKFDYNNGKRVTKKVIIK